MNELIPYLFSSSDDADDAPTPIRIVMQGDIPWFVAADLCRVLGIKNPTDALRALDDDEYRAFDLRTGNTLGDGDGIPRNTLGDSDPLAPRRGNPRVNIVSESGLYALIFRSRKPVARKFRRWVTEEVLPSIRRTGHYDQTVAVGHHPQGPSLSWPQIKASLHQHQLRVLAALEAIALPVIGPSAGDPAAAPVATIAGFGQIADIAGLSVESVRRSVRLLVQLGVIDVRDPATRSRIDDTPAGRA